jgi:hypothetical protein
MAKLPLRWSEEEIYANPGVPCAERDGPFLLVMPPYGGVERPRRVVRFARLMHRRVRALDGPSARAGFGGDPMTNRLPRMVVLQSPRP